MAVSICQAPAFSRPAYRKGKPDGFGARVAGPARVRVLCSAGALPLTPTPTRMTLGSNPSRVALPMVNPSRNKVMAALQWLALNHPLYSTVTISQANLDSYPENEPPVGLLFRRSTAENAEALPVYETVSDRLTEHGEAPFIVHGLDCAELARMTYDAKVALAVRHFDQGHAALAYGHESSPETMYHNARLFPGMFPWLYPYGRGGFENHYIDKKLDRADHIRLNLMYHDRRFQTDRCFPFIVFNHEQIRASSQGGFLLTHRKNFALVAERLVSLDREALDSLIERSKDGAYVKPENDGEKQCFELLTFVDHVAGHVKGSNTTRKYQRNEIRSLIYAKGTPTFFLTFAPADYKNPICLSFCGESINLLETRPALPGSDDRLRAIANNPVGAARFFDHVVKLFITCILRHGSTSPGLFGESECYYGTVEAQGRLTLHLHTLIWIKHSLSPQDIRDRILADPVFETRLLAWLEDCHTGDFLHTTGEQLSLQLEDEYVRHMPDGTTKLARKLKPHIRDPATTLPSPPPTTFTHDELNTWFHSVEDDVDQIVFCSNRHDLIHGKGCWRGDDETGYCKARFPRETFENTEVDRASGAIRFRKHEPWINTFHPVVSYLLRTNTDVACLLSGTQVKAIIAYVTDYITKSSLSTHTFFEIVRSVLDRNTESLNAAGTDRDRVARSIIVKIVNALSGASEIGGPAVCAHLLGNPDHYTSECFKVFYWYGYVQYFLHTSEAIAPDGGDSDERVLLGMAPDGVVIMNKLNDYIFRPRALSSWSLYDFLRLTDVRKLRDADNFVQDRTMDAHSDSESSEDDDADALADSYAARSAPRAHRFLANHPLRSSHGIFVKHPSAAYVLNFVGKALPRPDKGDHDEYCATMLAFFAPGGWRTGRDLRVLAENWCTVYDATVFDSAHIQVMKNMNVLYECQDARDDYAAERRAAGLTAGGRFAFGSNGSAHGNSDELLFGDADYEHTERSLVDLLEEGAIGKRTAKTRKTMERMSSILPPSKPSLILSREAFKRKEYPNLTSAQWKAILTEARLDAFDRLTSPGTRSETRVKPPVPSSPRIARFDAIVAPITVHQLQELLPSAQRSLGALQDAGTLLLHSTIEKFSLNAAQVRAFTIAATFLHHHHSEPLRMYLGGIAGTGKSRVLLALVSFLNERDERYRLLILGPTGSSAALIGGSTYHSALGILVSNENAIPSLTAVEKLRGRLARVDLIFIDEVSMISCYDLWRINSQLAKASSDSGHTFGGKGVVLAGDFAQLPPAGKSPSLYSNSVGPWSSSSTLSAQHNTIGKALWHEFVNVMLLRENMRQAGMTDEDVRFRTALNNMRYCRCTKEDIELILSRVWLPTLANGGWIPERFRGVSVITALNAERDAVNAIGVTDFAQRHGKQLYYFHSLDKWGKVKDPSSIRRAQHEYDSAVDPTRTSDHIAPRIQEALWAIPPTLTDHHAGILPLCQDMPVLLKYNEATELCATNGAEATVDSWDAHEISDGRLVLDTLYVTLTNPPRTVQLPGLPPNVIPLSRNKKTITCILPNGDLKVSIQRHQVMVLPNFSMTDYASQGRTRENNVCHPENCKNHLAMYTCLTRGSSLQGTLIIGSFDTAKIQGGPSKALKREFRELEILDYVTSLSEADQLPPGVGGASRASVIASFQAWRGVSFVPDIVHPALDWTDAHPSELAPDFETSDIPPLRKYKQVTQHTNSVPTPSKRSRTEQWSTAGPPKRRTALAQKDTSAYDIAPVARQNTALQVRYGLQWDSTNWSCAYDAVFTVFWNAFKDRGVPWTMSIAPENELMHLVSHNMAQITSPALQLLSLRNVVRDILFGLQPATFPRQGTSVTAVGDVLRFLFTRRTAFGASEVHCAGCGSTTIATVDACGSFIWALPPSAWTSHPVRALMTPTEYVCAVLQGAHTGHCAQCHAEIPIITVLHSAPPVLFLDASSGPIAVQADLQLPAAGAVHAMRLTAVIYHGFNHFTTRYFDPAGNAWYHDGAATLNVCVAEPGVGTWSSSMALASTRGRNACYYMYVAG